MEYRKVPVSFAHVTCMTKFPGRAPLLQRTQGKFFDHSAPQECVKPAESSLLLNIFRHRVTFVALLWNDGNISKKDDREIILFMGTFLSAASFSRRRIRRRE